MMIYLCFAHFLYFCSDKVVMSLFDENTSARLGVVVGHIDHYEDARCYLERRQDC